MPPDVEYRGRRRLVYCLQSLLLSFIGVLATVAVVLLVFGSCSIATRPWPPSTHGLVTLIGGGLLMFTCFGLLIVLCLWTGTCCPFTHRPRRNEEQPPSPPVIVLDSVASRNRSPVPTKSKNETRYLSPGLYRNLGGGGQYAPLAQEEELTPSLRSSFHSAEDLS